MSEAPSEGARADRYAAELLERVGTPTTYEAAVKTIAVAYIQGAADSLKWARDAMRGDAA